MQNTALVIIDIQNDYFKGGKFELESPEVAAQNAKILLDKFRELKKPIFHIQHIFQGENAPFFKANSDGAKIYELVAPNSDEMVVVKHFPDAFLNTELGYELERLDIENLVICGMMTHMCVDTSVRSAAAKGFKVVLAHDACAGRELEFDGKKISAKDAHTAYMSALAWAFADVRATKDIVANLS